MSTAPVTDTTITSDPTPEAVPVVDFDFKFAGIPVEITVWPTLGDTWKETKDGFEFAFPRLRTTQRLFKTLMVGVQIVEGTRVPFDMEEFKRKMAELKTNGKDKAV
jgi:hypothetical protein